MRDGGGAVGRKRGVLGGGTGGFGFWRPSLTRPQLNAIRFYSNTFGLPPQVPNAVLEAEIALDTDWKDSIETAAFFWRPRAAWKQMQRMGYNDPGPGLGNVHVTTAVQVSKYFAANYPNRPEMQFGYETMKPHRVAYVLSTRDGNIKTAVGLMRMLADLRFGTYGQTTLNPPTALNNWTKTDVAVMWHGYRYGVADYTPGGEGFSPAANFQDRRLTVSEMLSLGMIEGSGAADSVHGAYPMINYYLGQ